MVAGATGGQEWLGAPLVDWDGAVGRGFFFPTRLGLVDSSAKPVVDLAAPRLRARCCGDFIDREENHDPGGNCYEIGFDEWKAIRERPLGKGILSGRVLIGCFHMSGLFLLCFDCRWP